MASGNGKPHVAAARQPVRGVAGGRILIADDHPLVRLALRQLIGTVSGWECCGEAGDPREAIARLLEGHPHLVLLDFYLRRGDCLELIPALKQLAPAVKILIISRVCDPETAVRALRAGAAGFLIKEEPPRTILRAIESVLAGGHFVSDSIAGEVMRRLLEDRRTGAEPAVARLSNREFVILNLLGRGLTNRAIAGDLGVSHRTIESYRERLKSKLKLPDSARLMEYATRLAIQTDDSQAEEARGPAAGGRLRGGPNRVSNERQRKS